MIDFDERDVPADVRARISETVRRGMAEPARRGLRPPLAVAASVAVLLVAGLVTVLALHDRPEQVPARPAPAPSTTHAPAPDPAAQEIDRCWAAVVAAGKQKNFPARSKWTSVQRQTSTSANVTALRGDGKTFFCMTTRATVTVSDPKAHVTPAHGTSIRVMLADDNGWVLGTSTVADEYVTVETDGYGAGVEPTDGVFLIHVDAMADLASHVRLQVGDGFVDVPAVPVPAVVRTDRPLPPPDRDSKDGKRLGQCLSEAGWPKSYADQWQPVVATEHGESYAVMAVSDTQFGMCTTIAGVGRFVPMDALPTSAKPQVLLLYASTPVLGPDGDHMFVVGTVAATAKTMILRPEGGGTVSAVVRGGMWLAAIPTGPIRSVQAKDVGGKVLYDGPPAEAFK